MVVPPLTADELRANILRMLDHFQEIERAVRRMAADLGRALAAERNN
jgi:hypothetical protein